MPARNAADGSLLNISRADVYRIAEPLTSPLSLSEEEFAARSTLIATVPIGDDDFARRQLAFTDTLNFAGQPARLRYAVRFVNAAGQKAAFSNFLLIEPAARVADVPAALEGAVSQTAVALSWRAPSQNVDNSTPPNILGYNLYRLDHASNSLKTLNAATVTRTEFLDTGFEFGKDYTYFARTVSLGTNGEPLESLDSNAFRVTPKDVFPPAPPNSITIAAAPGAISIFFAGPLETDVAGYRIYRTLDRTRPREEWDLLTPQLLTTNTFQDGGLESGRTYYDYLTAVDQFGNVSERSEVIGETVP
jgi:hypothetical protein